MLTSASPALAVAAFVFVVAEGVLPNLVIVAMGRVAGHIPGAVEGGLGSAAGHALIGALALAGGVYALSLMRGPIEDALSAAVAARVELVLQQRVVAAVSAPAGIGHLEDPETLDRLSSASGELSGDRPANAPMTALSLAGDRLTGVIACVVLGTYRWWVGLLLFVVWILVRRPARAFITSRVTTFRRATGTLRRAGYLFGMATHGHASKEVRVFGLGDWLMRRHTRLWTRAMQPSWDELHEIDVRLVRVGIVVLAAYLVCGGMLGYDAYHGNVGLETVATMLPMLAMTMMIGTISFGDVALASMLATLPDVEALTSSLVPDQPLGRETGGTGAGGTAAGAGGAGTVGGAAGLPARELRFEHVSFRYPGAPADVLDDLDLTLPAGRSLAIVGVNGAGKTTLVTLLARLRDPTRGRILADGIPLNELDARAWQRQVAVVFQDFTRYPLTARENVALNLLGESVDEETLDRAATRADASELVAELPHGWDTVLSPQYANGTELSGGQWQRIALARALYAVERGARVLVLDEPTAQLDVRREAAFYDRFLELTAGTTSVVISHRFSTVRRADRIAVLDGGRVTELGTHDELLVADGEYARMFRLQAARFRARGERGGDGTGAPRAGAGEGAPS